MHSDSDPACQSHGIVVVITAAKAACLLVSRSSRDRGLLRPIPTADAMETRAQTEQAQACPDTVCLSSLLRVGYCSYSRDGAKVNFGILKFI